MYSLFQIVVFSVIQLALLPVTVAGYLYIIAKVMIRTCKLGISATSAGMPVTRWKLHVFGIRRDEVTVKMVAALPFISIPALWLTMGPAWIAYRLCGYIPRLARFVKPERASLITLTNCRTPLFDAIMAKHITGMDQVVLMGAGFDSRAFIFCKEKGIMVFELDRESTISLKVGALKKSGIDIDNGWINFIPVDFNHESWLQKLTANGYDTAKKTLFLWEGVTLYLEKKTVRDTLKQMASSSGGGSVIAFDLYSKEFVNYEKFFLLKYFGKNLLRISGEPLKYGIDTRENTRNLIEQLLRDGGLALTELVLLGQNNSREKPFAAVIEAVKS